MTSFIRRARPEETDALRELAHRSKAHWGYDGSFLAEVRARWSLSPAEVRRDQVHVLERDGRVLGWYRVAFRGADAELEDLWVEPEAIGEGHGRRLFEHAVRVAAARGFASIEWDADPNAEPFYRAVGGELIGHVPSSVRSDRLLPRMRYRIS